MHHLKQHSGQHSGQQAALTLSTMLLYSALRVSIGQFWMTESSTLGSGVVKSAGRQEGCTAGGGFQHGGASASIFATSPGSDTL